MTAPGNEHRQDDQFVRPCCTLRDQFHRTDGADRPSKSRQFQVEKLRQLRAVR
jgi:hypothetical protein